MNEKILQSAKQWWSEDSSLYRKHFSDEDLPSMTHGQEVIAVISTLLLILASSINLEAIF